MERVLLAYDLPKETVAAIRMLCKNMKVKVCSPGWRHRLLRHCSRCATRRHISPYLFIIYVLRMSIDIMKENSFKLAKERSGRYPAQTNMDTNYADDVVLLANTPSQDETLLHSLEWVPTGISLHVNTHKTKYMYFNQRGDISTQNSCSLNLVDKFTYQGSSLINQDRHQHATSKGIGNYQ